MVMSRVTGRVKGRVKGRVTGRDIVSLTVYPHFSEFSSWSFKIDVITLTFQMWKTSLSKAKSVLGVQTPVGTIKDYITPLLHPKVLPPSRNFILRAGNP